VIPQISIAPGVSSGMKMSDDVFFRVRQYIYERTGIYFQDNKKYLLEGRLGKRVLLLKLHDYDEYLNLLKYGAARIEETRHFYDAITINETFMFRNEPQFEALELKIIPEVLASKKGMPNPKIRIWSAASSSGEEAHTLAMIFLEKIKPKYPTAQLEVVGTDINLSVLETARKGSYREYSIRNTPPMYLNKYFTFDGARYNAKDEVRKMLKFQHLNLSDQASMKGLGTFDIIFCCNVLIYFDQKSKANVVQGLYGSLSRGGYLFVGYAESLHGVSTAFKMASFPKTVAYKKE
jgi:chemotaxis protein methyltransferase CheR